MGALLMMTVMNDAGSFSVVQAACMLRRRDYWAARLGAHSRWLACKLQLTGRGCDVACDSVLPDAY